MKLFKYILFVIISSIMLFILVSYLRFNTYRSTIHKMSKVSFPTLFKTYYEETKTLPQSTYQLSEFIDNSIILTLSDFTIVSDFIKRKPNLIIVIDSSLNHISLVDRRRGGEYNLWNESYIFDISYKSYLTREKDIVIYDSRLIELLGIDISPDKVWSDPDYSSPSNIKIHKQKNKGNKVEM